MMPVRSGAGAKRHRAASSAAAQAPDLSARAAAVSSHGRREDQATSASPAESPAPRLPGGPRGAGRGAIGALRSAAPEEGARRYRREGAEGSGDRAGAFQLRTRFSTSAGL